MICIFCLKTLTTNQELASEQADSIVERISDAQLDLLHRLSDQFRLVTASINTSAASTRQLIEQSTSRPDQSLSQQIQQFLDLLQSIPARQSSVSTPGLPQITEETLAFPTPPASQLVPTSQAFPPTRSSTSLESTHRCEAPECTACLIQANPMTHEVEPKALQALGTNGTKNSAAQNDDEGFHTLSQMPASSQAQMANLPIPGTVGSLPGEKSQMPQVHRGAASGERRTITSPVQSACSHRRRPLGALQPFIMKKRKIIQSDDEEDHSHEDAEQESVDDAALACSSKMPQVNLAAAAAAHGQAFDRVQAWRTGVATTSLAAEADQPGFLSIQPLAASQKVDVAKQLATAAEMPPESPQTKKKSMRPVKGGGLATKTAEQTAIGKRRKLA